MEEEEKKKKRYTPQQALLKAMQYCAYQERCQQEMRDKLYDWGLYPADVENCIAELITQGMLNEERFAITYAGGKFRIKKWGKIKIKLELKKRQISEYCIRMALNGIDPDAYHQVLTDQIEKKAKDVKEKKVEIKRYKVAQYIISKGFEPDLVWDTVNRLL